MPVVYVRGWLDEAGAVLFDARDAPAGQAFFAPAGSEMIWGHIDNVTTFELGEDGWYRPAD